MAMLVNLEVIKNYGKKAEDEFINSVMKK